MTAAHTRIARATARALKRARVGCRRAIRAAVAVTLLVLVAPQALFAAPAPATIAPASALTAQALPGPAVIDYPGGFNSSTPGRLKRAGVGIAIRYVAATRWKSLTRKEANSLRAAGIDIAAVYETKASWMLGGRAAGVAAAKKARSAVIACGGPRMPFVYFACDIATNRYSTVNACLQGAASVLGADHVGIYGSYDVCAYALKSGAATKAWQTEAWSGGRVLPQATLYQRAHHIDGGLGLDYDSNLVRADDIGQWGYAGPGSVAWTAEPTSTAASLTGVDFVGTAAGWATGSDGSIRHTVDGGISWAQQSVPTTAVLEAVHFVDADAGWAVGEAGTVLRTADGGSVWTTQSVPTSATLRAVDFADDDAGWAVGEAGTVLRTTDGGSDWTTQSVPTSATLRTVRFVDTANGWAAGQGGTLLHTANGGSTWTTQSVPTSATLNGVDFVDSHSGWAVGAAGTVLHTVNGGATWAAQSSTTSATLSAVRFTDSSTGWAVGSGGTLLQTSNGGSTWTVRYVPTSAGLLGADFADAHTGWAVGEAGTVLKGVGVGLTPFATISGVVTNAVTGARVGNVAVTVGTRPASPVATDGTFVAARTVPGTYTVTFSDPRYVTASYSGVAALGGKRATVRVRLTPKTPTALSAPSFLPTVPLAAQPVTLSVTLSPSSAATAGATTLTGWHYEAKTVTKKIKGKRKKVKVWYWRTVFASRMSAQGGGSLVVRRGLARGSWRVQARFAGSGRFLPATSTRVGFGVH